jgi:branched-chain amino acid transport system substrate-binding protein
MKHRLAIFAAVALWCAGAVAPARAADPYTVSVVLSLTGGAAFLGTKEASSLHVLEGLVNAAGGVRGRPVKFDIADDGSNPQTAVQLVNDLVAKNVPFIYGPTLTAVCQAVAPITDKAGPATFCLSPTIFPRPGGYMFMGAPSIDDVQPVLYRYLLSRKLVKVALITSTDASGSDFEKRVDGTLAQPEFKDIKIVAREHFAPADISVAAQMAHIKAAEPDVLLTFTVGTPFGTLLKGVHDSGLDVPVYGSGGNFTYAQMQQYASFLPKELILNGSRGITPDPTATGAIKKAQDVYFNALTAAGVRSEFATSIPWDPMMIMLEVVRRAGTDADAARIYATLENLKGWTGIEGTYDFTTKDQRGLGQAAAALFRYDQANNVFVQVYPVKK